MPATITATLTDAQFGEWSAVADLGLIRVGPVYADTAADAVAKCERGLFVYLAKEAGGGLA